MDRGLPGPVFMGAKVFSRRGQVVRKPSGFRLAVVRESRSAARSRKCAEANAPSANSESGSGFAGGLVRNASSGALRIDQRHCVRTQELRGNSNSVLGKKPMTLDEIHKLLLGWKTPRISAQTHVY